MAYLGDGAREADAGSVATIGGVDSTFVDIFHLFRTVVLSRLDGHPGAIDTVAGVGCDNTSVLGSVLADHNAGAVQSFELRRNILCIDSYRHCQNRNE